MEQAQKELKHIPSAWQQVAPLRPLGKQYGAKIQYVKDGKTKPLDKNEIRYIQQVIGKFLYYTQVINNVMIHALNNISSTIVKGTKATHRAVQ